MACKNKTKRVNKYFLGGSPNEQNSWMNTLQNQGQVMTGAATGDIGSIISGGMGMAQDQLGSIMTTGERLASKDLTGKEKRQALGIQALKQAGPIGTVVGGVLDDRFSKGLQKRQTANADFNNALLGNQLKRGGRMDFTMPTQQYNIPQQPLQQGLAPMTPPITSQEQHNMLRDYQRLTRANEDAAETIYSPIMPDPNRQARIVTNAPSGMDTPAARKAAQKYIDIANTDPSKFKRKTPRMFASGGDMLTELNGNSHEEGGILLTPGNEVEGNETMGDIVRHGFPEKQIFSDRPEMKFTKQDGVNKSWINKTPSRISKKIKKPSGDYPEDEMYNDFINQQLAALADEQDMKRNMIESPILAKGGAAKRYDNGGGMRVDNPGEAFGYDDDRAKFGEKTARLTFKLFNEFLKQGHSPQEAMSKSGYNPINTNNSFLDKYKNQVGETIPPQSQEQPIINSNPSLQMSPIDMQQTLSNIDRMSMGTPMAANRDNIYNASNQFGVSGLPPEGTRESLGTGEGYQRYTRLGKDYEQYSNNLKNVFDISDPTKKQALLDLFDVNNPINQTPERQAWLKEIHTKQPQVLNNPSELLRLATDGKEGPVHSLISASAYIPKMTGRETNLVATPPSMELSGLTSTPGTPEPPPVTEDSSTDYQPRPEWMRFAPLAQGALAFAKAPELERFNPTTMSAGYLRPQMVDEQTMQAQIAAANRGNVGALANVSGGSGAAQRAGLLGAGSNYMDATGSAFLQANQANNAAIMGADQFNIGNQANVAGQNMQALNQAGAYNTQAKNALNQQMFDTRLGMAQDTLKSMGNIGQENMARNMYDWSALQTAGATGEGGFVQEMPQRPSNMDYLFGRKPRVGKYGGVISTKINKSGLKSELL